MGCQPGGEAAGDGPVICEGFEVGLRGEQRWNGSERLKR